MRTGITCAGAIALALSLAIPQSAPVAQDVAAFYKNKTFTILVGHYTGTGFDLVSRLLARHMGKHIPGNPGMVVKNMAGASGVSAANWLYNSAPRDGSVMGIFVYTVPLEKLFGNRQARFDPAKMLWIGNIEKASALCGVNKSTGIKTFADLQNAKKPVIFGGTGATGPLVTAVNAMKNLLGAKVTIVPGYKGMPDVRSAMLRGEVQGMCSLYWSVAATSWSEEIKTGVFVPVLQYSGDKLAQFPNVTHTDDLAKSDADRQVFQLAFGIADMARTYAMPPGVPMERVTAVRKAFMDTMKDKDFVAAATKLKIELAPETGEAVAKSWAAAGATPAAVVEKAKKALSTR